jgi:dynein heavy chain 1
MTLAENCAAWKKSYLPESLKRMERDKSSINSPLFRFLDRETIIGEDLLVIVLNDLDDIHGVCNETVKPTNRLRMVMKKLSKGLIPDSEWAKYPMSSMEASIWIEDFGHRIKQLANITANRIDRHDWAHTPLWLGGLFSPEAFITATRQEVSQRLDCSLEELSLEITIGGEQEGKLESSEFGSFLTHRLSLEGASWDGENSELKITEDDVISTPLPPTSFRWTRETQDTSNFIEVPVYLNSKRTSILFTVQLRVSSAVPLSIWCQRAVALIAWSRLI